MKKALIQGTRICQIVNPGDEFPVSSGLSWVDVADDTVADKDTYVSGDVVKFVPPTLTAMEAWLADMAASDKTMTRIEEDIIGSILVLDATLPADVIAKYNAKKALRASKP